MKSTLSALAALLLVAAVVPARADQASAIAAVRQVYRVVDAKADTGGNLYVLVKEENLDWGRYAAALCKLVKPHQARIFRVRMIELTKANNTKPPASWPRLGEAACG